MRYSDATLKLMAHDPTHGSTTKKTSCWQDIKELPTTIAVNSSLTVTVDALLNALLRCPLPFWPRGACSPAARQLPFHSPAGQHARTRNDVPAPNHHNMHKAPSSSIQVSYLVGSVHLQERDAQYRLSKTELWCMHNRKCTVVTFQEF